MMWLKLKPSTAPKVEPIVIGNTAYMKETSGLMIDDDNHILSIEDGGNPPTLFSLDTLGQLLEKRLLPDISNIDWEEITSDSTQIFIGDIGNNYSQRKDLMIYSINKQDFINKNITNINKIYFKYEDQIDLKPSFRKRRFDAEAMLCIGDSLYVFTKDYTVPLIGESRIYRLPKTAGVHVALRVASIKTDNAAYGLGQITAATMSPDHKKIVLLANNAMYIYQDFVLPHFWEGSRIQYNFKTKKQREGITFADNCNLYISSEATPKCSAELSSLNLCYALMTKSPQIYFKEEGNNIFCYFEHIESKIKLQIIDNQGNVFYNMKFRPKKNGFVISKNWFHKNGIYTLQFTHKSHKWCFKKQITISGNVK